MTLVKSFLKHSIPSRKVNLGITPAGSGAVPAVALCEVTEFDHAEGWAQWEDSVFVQDFEDSTFSASVPGALQ